MSISSVVAPAATYSSALVYSSCPTPILAIIGYMFSCRKVLMMFAPYSVVKNLCSAPIAFSSLMVLIIASSVMVLMLVAIIGLLIRVFSETCVAITVSNRLLILLNCGTSSMSSRLYPS